jgi:hypothetical protein
VPEWYNRARHEPHPDSLEVAVIQTVEAVLDPSGAIRLREPLKVTKPTRVLVTILPEPHTDDPGMRELYDQANRAVTTDELDAAARQPGGRRWSEIRARLGGS